jgi:hypothetical protein
MFAEMGSFQDLAAIGKTHPHKSIHQNYTRKNNQKKDFHQCVSVSANRIQKLQTQNHPFQANLRKQKR